MPTLRTAKQHLSEFRIFENSRVHSRKVLHPRYVFSIVLTLKLRRKFVKVVKPIKLALIRRKGVDLAKKTSDLHTSDGVLSAISSNESSDE